MRLIDADEVRLQKGFFEKVTNVPKFYEWLDSLPTVDAVPVKHGRWLSCSSSEHYKCSCCGTRASFWFDEENSSGWQMDMSEWLSDYCPNCGARMDERKES